MELTALEIAYIAGGFGILGSLIGSITTHFLGKDLARRNNFNKSAQEFIFAFQNALVRLKSESTPTYDIIKPTITKHLEACSLFRSHLKGRELGRFKLAQHKYYFTTPICPNSDKTEQEREDERTAIIEKIEALLDFAKFK